MTARPIALLTALLFTLGAALPAIAAAPAAGAKPAQGPAPVIVVLKTTKGTIVTRLFPDKAPLTVKNFLEYAKAGHYDGTIFHRVVPGFVIQGGGFTPEMKEKPTKPAIRNEADNGLRNLRGTLSMARTGIVDSATSQFFINLADNGALDHRNGSAEGYGYAVFGEVIGGMDGKSTMPVVDAIGKLKTGRVKGMDEVPLETVTITAVKIMGEMPIGGMPTGMPTGMGKPAAPAKK